MDSSVGRSTRYREFCRQCLAIVSVTLAAEVLLLHNVKLTASWHAALIRIQDRNDLSTGSVLEEAHKMENDSTKDRFSRRGFLGIGSAALATVAGSLVVSSAMAQEGQQAAKTGTDRSATDPGPTNSAMDAQNPDSAWPPGTDSKSLVPTFKYPFSLANKRAYEGGWSREVTVRELPVSKTMAGVNMRLTAGGVRELHWHTAGEWSIMHHQPVGSRCVAT